MRPDLTELMERIGYRFSNPVLLEKALTHSSYANEGRHGLESNERLEFLGDSVLGMIAAVYLFEREKQPEGALTKLRASIVCEKALCGYSPDAGARPFPAARQGGKAKRRRRASVHPGRRL